MNRKHYKTYVLFLIITLILAVGAFFMVNVQMPDWAFVVSGINIVLFALPAVFAIVKWLGWKRGIVVFPALGIFAMVIETIAVTTGYPYGNFSYSSLLGYRILDVVPWSVGFAWTPLLLAASTVSRRILQNVWSRIFLTILIIVAFDLVLDPGAVFMGFWKYADGGIYYGVPFTNYVGWIVSGFIGAGIFEILLLHFKPISPAPRQLILSAYFTLIFWTLIALCSGLIFPAIIGIGLVWMLTWFYFKFE